MKEENLNIDNARDYIEWYEATASHTQFDHDRYATAKQLEAVEDERKQEAVSLDELRQLLGWNSNQGDKKQILRAIQGIIACERESRRHPG